MKIQKYLRRYKLKNPKIYCNSIFSLLESPHLSSLIHEQSKSV